MYYVGLLENLKLRDEIYPDWWVYIYHNSDIPISFLNKYKSFKNTVLFDMTNSNLPGKFWRFLPRENVQLFISRDADSRISMRQFNAVQEWINSTKILHIMRDHPNHNVKIFAGMFGLKIQQSFDMGGLMNDWLSKRNGYVCVSDCDVLNECLYDYYWKKNQIIAHDSQFNYNDDTRPFPDKLVNYRFVGQIFDKNNKPKHHWRLLVGKKEAGYD